MQYNPYYDQALQQYFQTGQAPAGMPTAGSYTINGQPVQSGNMQGMGDYTGAEQTQLGQINQQLNTVRNEGIGYTPQEIQAMNDTLSRQEDQYNTNAWAKMNASAASRGMGGVSLNASQLTFNRDAGNADANARAQILLGTADARMQGQNTQNQIASNLLGLGNTASQNIGQMQYNQGLYNSNLYNQVADPMRYQQAITDMLATGGKLAQGTGDLGLKGAEIQNQSNQNDATTSAAYGKGIIQLLQTGKSGSGTNPWNGLSQPSSTNTINAGSPSYSYTPQYDPTSMTLQTGQTDYTGDTLSPSVRGSRY
jgi:hypothetical protein